MSKQFRKNSDLIGEAIGKVANQAKSNTILCIYVNDKEFDVKYTGRVANPKSTKESVHDIRLMKALMACPQLSGLFWRIAKPVHNFEMREAKKRCKEMHIKPLRGTT